jgi:hypothetical protein
MRPLNKRDIDDCITAFAFCCAMILLCMTILYLTE